MTDRIGPTAPPLPGSQPNPRKTEENDTRQDILHHDPDFFKKQREGSERPAFKDPYEDLTDVSVVALRAFLVDLLAKAGIPQGEMPAAAQSQVAAPVIPPTAPQPVSPQAAAVNAYRHGAMASPTLPPLAAAPVAEDLSGQSDTGLTDDTADAQPTALDRAAAALDPGELLALIRSLDKLYARGVTSIALEKGDGFLASIRVGIEKAAANSGL